MDRVTGVLNILKLQKKSESMTVSEDCVKSVLKEIHLLIPLFFTGPKLRPFGIGIKALRVQSRSGVVNCSKVGGTRSKNERPKSDSR